LIEITKILSENCKNLQNPPKNIKFLSKLGNKYFIIILTDENKIFLLKVQYPHKNPIIVAKFNAAKVH